MKLTEVLNESSMHIPGVKQNMDMNNLPDIIQEISKLFKETPLRSYKQKLGRKYRWETNNPNKLMKLLKGAGLDTKVNRVVRVPHSAAHRRVGSVSVVI